MSNENRSRMVDWAGANLHRATEVQARLRTGGVYTTRCYRKGKLLWEDVSKNIVTNVGLTYLEGVALLTTTQIALTSWFVGITASAPTVAAADTAASHGGWTENTSYSQGTRPAWSGVAGSAGASSNTASPATFSANASSTVGGCFLISNSTKGGTTGTLFSAVAFTGGDRSLVNGDTLTVTYNHSVVDDGV